VRTNKVSDKRGGDALEVNMKLVDSDIPTQKIFADTPKETQEISTLEENG
jgi:hypothetical protein